MKLGEVDRGSDTSEFFLSVTIMEGLIGEVLENN